MDLHALHEEKILSKVLPPFFICDNQRNLRLKAVIGYWLLVVGCSFSASSESSARANPFLKHP
jgi:hypothetical protein